MNKSLHTWLRLFRAPNLFTVPGDPLAGWLLAGALSGRAFLTAGASLFFYAAGLLLNDLFDLEEDRRERPARPLPSGAVSKGAVLAVAVAFGLMGLGFCALAGAAAFRAGLGILLCVLAYNGGLKKLPLFGAVNMGLCRGFSVLLGGAAASGLVFENAAAPAALVITLYIAAVTNLARTEMGKRCSPLDRWLPFLALLAGIALLYLRSPLFAAAFLVPCLAAGWIGYRLGDPAVPVPPNIGALIRLLLLVQAAFCATAPGGMPVALALLAFWPVSSAVGRRFAGS